MIKLGIVGMSPGNAHPYSWSAIINGRFDGDEITRTGYPAVADYLHANRDTLGMEGVRVTHVWTQDKEISRSIASSAGIAGVAETMEEMIGMVDAVLLSRDDPENHVAMARPFIDADVPIFIDKPIAATAKDLDYFSNEVAKGKFIMSCSSMRYASECRSAKTAIKSLGTLNLVTAVGKKDWTKYGIHLLEAVFAMLDDPKPVSITNAGDENKAVVSVVFESGLVATIHLFMDICATFQISLFGRSAWYFIDIKNSYAMFRDNIIEFIRSVREGRPRLSFDKTEHIIRTLMAGEESLRRGGKKITL